MAMAQPETEQPRRNKAVTWRSILICLLIMPLNSYWVVQMEVVRYSAHPTTISLFFNTVFILLCLTLLNRGVRRIAPRMALERGELLLIFSGLSISSCVSGHDMLEVFVPMLTWTFKHADSSNEWAKIINPHLRDGLFIKDEAIWKSYYLGNDSIWHWRYVSAWLPVVTASRSLQTFFF